MDSFVRISPQNSANIVQNGVQINNIVDFIVPSGGVYDLSKCYISLPLRVKETTNISNVLIMDNTGATNPGIFIKPEILIKNINVKSDVLGVIEDIKEVGFLRSVLNDYRKDGLHYSRKSSPFGNIDEYGEVNSPFRLLRKIGTEISEELTAECQIPLKDILHLGEQRAYSTAKYGALYISVELDFGKGTNALTPFQAGGTAGILEDTTYWGKPVIKSGTARNVLTFADAAATTLVTTATYEDLKQSPFYVGQALVLTAPSLTTADKKITAISYASDGSMKLNLTVDSAMGGATGTDATCSGKNAAGLNINVDVPELVMSTSNIAPPDMFEVLTWNTEADSSATGLNINKVYQVAPSALSVVVLGKQLAGSKYFSSFSQLADYRFRVDNKDITDRAVLRKSSIHYGLLRDVFANMGYPLKNLNERTKAIVAKKIGLEYPDNVLIGCALPDNGQPKLVDVEINCAESTTGPAGGIVLYSNIIKQF